MWLGESNSKVDNFAFCHLWRPPDTHPLHDWKTNIPFRFTSHDSQARLTTLYNVCINIYCYRAKRWSTPTRWARSTLMPCSSIDACGVQVKLLSLPHYTLGNHNKRLSCILKNKVISLGPYVPRKKASFLHFFGVHFTPSNNSITHFLTLNSLNHLLASHVLPHPINSQATK